MDREQQIAALDLFEALAFATPRIAGDDREAALNFVAFQRALLAKKNPATAISVYRGPVAWHIKIDDRPAVTIPHGLTGLDAIYDLLRLTQALGPIDRPLAAFPDLQGRNAALTLIKRLARARERITLSGAPEFADFIGRAICVSKKRETVRCSPVNGFVVTVPTRYQNGIDDNFE